MRLLELELVPLERVLLLELLARLLPLLLVLVERLLLELELFTRLLELLVPLLVRLVLELPLLTRLLPLLLVLVRLELLLLITGRVLVPVSVRPLVVLLTRPFELELFTRLPAVEPVEVPLLLGTTVLEELLPELMLPPLALGLTVALGAGSLPLAWPL